LAQKRIIQKFLPAVSKAPENGWPGPLRLTSRVMYG
jgi:hypothetical protein